MNYAFIIASALFSSYYTGGTVDEANELLVDTAAARWPIPDCPKRFANIPGRVEIGVKACRLPFQTERETAADVSPDSPNWE
jgi:hypothetical protein